MPIRLAPEPAPPEPPSGPAADGRAPGHRAPGHRPPGRDSRPAPLAAGDGAPEAFRALATLQRHAPEHEGLERLAAELAARLAPDLARSPAPRLLGLLRRGATPEEAEAVLSGLEPLLAEYGLVLGRRWRAARDGVFVFAGLARPAATYAGATARAVRVAAPGAGIGSAPGAEPIPAFPPRLDIA